MHQSAVALILIASTLSRCCVTVPLIYEVIPLVDRIRVSKARDEFTKAFENHLNRSIEELSKSLQPVLFLNLEKIDPGTPATELVTLIAKIGESASSYLIAPLFIPVTVKEDTQNFEDTFIEVLLPEADGSEGQSSEEATVDPLGTILSRFIRSDLPASISDDVRKSLESIQEALVYPSAFMKDNNESIPIDVILGLFSLVERKDVDHHSNTNQDIEPNSIQSNVVEEPQKAHHSDEM